MTARGRALVARMLWAGLPPDTVANTTGYRLDEVRAIAGELAEAAA